MNNDDGIALRNSHADFNPILNEMDLMSSFNEDYLEEIIEQDDRGAGGSGEAIEQQEQGLVEEDHEEVIVEQLPVEELNMQTPSNNPMSINLGFLLSSEKILTARKSSVNRYNQPEEPEAV